MSLCLHGKTSGDFWSVAEEEMEVTDQEPQGSVSLHTAAEVIKPSLVYTTEGCGH